MLSIIGNATLTTCTPRQMYAATSPNASAAMSVFAKDVIYSSPRGDVFVGHNGLAKLFDREEEASIKLHQRLLTTPETLPANTMVVDQIAVVSSSSGEQGDENDNSMEDDSEDHGRTLTTRSLLVLKRRSTDGLVSHITEEEGHRRATAPLAARAASASNFYSPTDNMVSPCTSKLNLAKRKHHAKAKPMTLFASQMANSGPARRQPSNMSASAISDMDF